MLEVVSRFVFFAFLAISNLSSAQDARHTFARAIQLKKSSYWIYESRSVQLGSNLITPNKEDSIFIRSDTVIKNNHFYRIENVYGLSEFKRDSSGCIVDEKGNIEFSSRNTKDTLFNNDNGIGFMSGRVERVTVPAGTFSAMLFYVVRKLPAGAIIDKRNPTFFNSTHSIVRKIWYANDVGVIKSIFYYGTTSAFERNLIRYNLNYRS